MNSVHSSGAGRHLALRPMWACLLLLLLLAAGCKKEEGIGGGGTIRGRMMVNEYSGGAFVGTHEGMDERVYLVFGDDLAWGDDTRTNYNGVFEFQFLYPGDYTIVMYTDCDTCIGGTKEVLTTVQINKNSDVVDVGDIYVRR